MERSNEVMLLVPVAGVILFVVWGMYHLTRNLDDK